MLQLKESYSETFSPIYLIPLQGTNMSKMNLEDTRTVQKVKVRLIAPKGKEKFKIKAVFKISSQCFSDRMECVLL